MLACAEHCMLPRNATSRIRESLSDSSYLERDIVRSAAIFSQLNKAATGILRRLRRERLLYFRFTHLAPQTVGTNQQDIRFFQLHRFNREVRIDVSGNPESSSEHMFLRMMFSVFRTDNSGLDKARHQRMIASQKLKLPSPEQVEMAVANVRVIETSID